MTVTGEHYERLWCQLDQPVVVSHSCVHRRQVMAFARRSPSVRSSVTRANERAQKCLRTRVPSLGTQGVVFVDVRECGAKNVMISHAVVIVCGQPLICVRHRRHVSYHDPLARAYRCGIVCAPLARGRPVCASASIRHTDTDAIARTINCVLPQVRVKKYNKCAISRCCSFFAVSVNDAIMMH